MNSDIVLHGRRILCSPRVKVLLRRFVVFQLVLNHIYFANAVFEMALPFRCAIFFLVANYWQRSGKQRVGPWVWVASFRECLNSLLANLVMAFMKLVDWSNSNWHGVLKVAAPLKTLL